VRLLETGQRLAVEGELSMAGSTGPLTAHVDVADPGAVAATITLMQSDWGIKPYRGLMGTLKVRDEVEIAIAAASASS
jgi:polyisoprenoid-binding protein YceI